MLEVGTNLAKGGLDVLVHHGNVGLEDPQRSSSQAGRLIDGHPSQIRVPVPVVLQDEHQLLNHTLELMSKDHPLRENKGKIALIPKQVL